MIAVIRIRGRVGVRKEIKDTMTMLHLKRKNTCVVVPETPQYIGMIRKVKDFVTWGIISEKLLEELVTIRGRTENGKVDEKSINSIVKKLKEGKIKETDLKPFFRLSPPSKGFKGSVKQHYPLGVLGNRKDAINDLLKRMI